MAGLCRNGARYACLLDDPTPSRRFLEEAQKLRNDVAAAEAIAALDAAGITSILLKGPAMAHWLYEEGEHRWYGDVDLLVSPTAFDGAQETLTALGFRRVRLESTRPGRDGHHESWYRSLDGSSVELHRSLLGVGASDDHLWKELESRTEHQSLGVLGADARVPDAVARCLIVALHAAAHGPDAPKPLEDLRRALDRVPEETWTLAADLARRLDAEGSLRLGLGLVPGGDDLAKRLGQPERRASTEAILRAGNAPPTALGWEKLAHARGARAKLRYALAELFPAADYLRAVDALAHRGRLGLVGAYVRRPVRLAGRAPKGFRAWRSARRRAGA